MKCKRDHQVNGADGKWRIAHNEFCMGLHFNLSFFFPSSVQIDIIVTTAGGIEEDLIKCLAPTYLGDFSLKGSDLRPKGINRYIVFNGVSDFVIPHSSDPPSASLFTAAH